ncbi:hypothetical protein GCM10007421_30260 [Halopseudomonas oceani]|nr:hypothetical protein GCM10007421_30260 [Halopseudomonas oceani]
MNIPDHSVVRQGWARWSRSDSSAVEKTATELRSPPREGNSIEGGQPANRPQSGKLERQKTNHNPPIQSPTADSNRKLSAIAPDRPLLSEVYEPGTHL